VGRKRIGEGKSGSQEQELELDIRTFKQELERRVVQVVSGRHQGEQAQSHPATLRLERVVSLQPQRQGLGRLGHVTLAF